jgi:hypothetical protein
MSKSFPDCFGLRLFRALGLCLLVAVCGAVSFGQTYVDAPVLVSEYTSTRALTVNPDRWRGQFPVAPQGVFNPLEQSRVAVFVYNLDLLAGEGANAFRADLEDANGRQIPLFVESITPVKGYDWIHAVVLRLNLQLGDLGDALLRITWRGMSSNRVRLAIGHVGGGPLDDPDAKPTGAPLSRPKPSDVQGYEQQRIGPLFSGDRIRFMEQATFGPTDALDLRLRRLGILPYIAEQQDLPYPGVAYPVQPQMPINPAADCLQGTDCFRDNYTMYPLQRWFYRDALYGNAQVRRRVSWALSQIFVVSGQDIPQPSQMLPYIKTLDRNAFGNFRTLLTEITLNGAMGNYLDMASSTRTNPNENYAREILQLFSVGLYKLNLDGTLMLDVNSNPIPTYDQDVVNGFSRVFTGWRLCVSGCANSIPGIPNYQDPMVLVAANHEPGVKELLDSIIQPANQGGDADLTAALDNIFYHPNVGPFISKQLIQHMVTSDPTPAYVARVATIFNNNGSGVRGDLKAVVRAILTDPEARGDVKTDPNYGYLREPVLFVTNILRQFNARAANGAVGSQSDGQINPQTQALGQDVFRAPSVFNYYPPDYIVPVNNIHGPEFYLLTTSTAFRRANFGNTIIFGTLPASTPPNTNAPNGTSIDMSELQALAAADTSGGLLLDKLNQKMMHGTMSTEMRNIITTAVLAVPSANALTRARTAVYLVATSSQYQVQR